MMMNKKVWTLTLLTLALLLAACGVLQEPEAPSAPIEAVPLEAEEEADASEDAADEVMEEEEAADEAMEEEAMEEEMAEEEEMEEEEMAEEEAEETAEEETAAESAGEATIFEISQDESQVRFELDEDLRGNRITVVGETDQVAGQISLDLANLAATQIGIIQINARALETDNNFRNRAIQNEILDTGSFEFITFSPTAVNDLSGSAAVGDSVQFSIVGDLTIRDVTNEVTFTVDATAVSETTVSGTASAVVSLEAYGLQIPSVPNVANVEEEVELYIDFTANAS